MHVVSNLDLFRPEVYTVCLVIFSRFFMPDNVSNYMGQSAPAEVHISSVSQEVASVLGNLMYHNRNLTFVLSLFRAL